MIKKISDKDKIDWQNFLSNKEKIIDKEIFIKKNTRQHLTKKIDLHGFSLDSANDMIEKFIKKSYDESVNKIIVITGKGLHSKSSADPYVSKNLSILKYSVPEYINNNKTLLNLVRKIQVAEIKDGGSGALYIFLKKKTKFKE